VLARLKGLFKNLAVYGMGDVATSVASLLLLPVYTRYLSPEEYGVIAMLLIIEAVAKILFRWGVDTAFMRMYYDCQDQAARQKLASTIFGFLLAVNGTLLLAGMLAAPWLSVRLFGATGQALLISLVILNTFVVGFYFIPFQVLRITEQPRTFIALVFSRSISTLLLRLLLVIGAGMGVLGIVLADLAVTAVFTLVMIRWFTPLIRPVFSRELLKGALGFGLPRIPHSIANQVISVADRYFLNKFTTLADVGLYSIGATFGLGLKLFLSAFEYAWTPFFLGVMKEPDARDIYRKISTYIVAVLILLVAGLCAMAGEIVRLFTAPEFHGAAVVTPWIALGVMCQGLYLVGSIGLIITRKTSSYPIATGIAAATSVTANTLLIPRFGLMGAAYSQTIAYATLALVTIAFSQRAYPISYEWGRLARIAAAGLLAFAAGIALPPYGHTIVVLALRGLAVVGVYTLVLYVTGFFTPGEFRVLQDIRRRSRQKKPKVPIEALPPEEVEMAGEIVSSAPEPPVNPDSPAPRR
jgi:O-antigen/teichoic acid export membrane protein